MIYDIPAPAAEIARRQSGAISRRQLLDSGWTSQMIMTRLERQRWQMLYRGVYATFSGPPARDTWLWAAVLRAGQGAVLSHQTAAELHGLIDDPAEATYVTVPASRRITSRGLVIFSSGRIGRARQPNREPPRTSVEETVLDLTQRASTLDEVCGWITKACGRRLTTEARLRAALKSRKKVRWRDELGDILTAAADGIHSVLEYRYLRDVERAHALPRSHPDDERWRDTRRDNQARARGVETARYDWRDIHARACETALLQAQILRARGWLGTPRPCSARCPVGRGWRPAQPAAGEQQGALAAGRGGSGGSGGSGGDMEGFWGSRSTGTGTFASHLVRLGESGTPSLVFMPAARPGN